MLRPWTLKTRLFITAIIVALICSMTGCIFTVKVRNVSWPGVRVRREVPLYYIGAIKFEAVYFRPSKGATKFSIRMPDGLILTSEQLTPEALEPYVTPFEQLTREIHPSWSEHSIVEYDNGQVMVYFENCKATRIAVFVNYRSLRPGQSVPAIGNRDGSQVFPLPITEDELIKLFGEPTKARTYLFNT